jgi:hypothetical protein
MNQCVHITNEEKFGKNIVTWDEEKFMQCERAVTAFYSAQLLITKRSEIR